MSDFPPHWNFMAIGDFASRVRRKNKGGVCLDPMTISAVDGLVSQQDYFKKIVASKNTEGYTLLHKNDFAYNKSYSEGYPVGAARRLKSKDMGIVSPLYICFELDEKKIEPRFADYLFDSDWFIQAIYGIAKEGARSHGLLNIGIEEFFSASMPIPPLPEQKKVAEILSGIDNIQHLLTQKLEILGNLLIATRDDLFLQGELSGEMKKLPISEFINSGDITLIQDGNHGEKHPKSSQFSNSGIPFVMASHVRGGRFIPDLGKCLSEEIVSGLRIGHSMSGDVLLTHKASVGETCVVPDSYQQIILSPQVTLYRLHENSLTTPFFLKEWFMTTCFQREISEASGQSTRDYIGITAQQKLHAMKPLNKNVEASISEGLLPISRSIECLSGNLNCWNELRAALSADLLSGRKRVSV